MRVIALLDVGIAPEQINEGQIRCGFAIRDRGAFQDPPALEVVRMDELIDEARLSDPGLTDQGHHLPVSGLRTYQGLDESHQLQIPSNKAGESSGRGRLQAPPDPTRP